MLITSLDNDRVKKYIKLKSRKYRDEYNEFIVEGMHLVLEAYKNNLIEELILEQDEVLPFKADIIYLPMEIMKKISTMDSPPKVMALCKKIIPNDSLGSRILLLDEIQDPGNLGTIIRSAKAFNVDSVVLSENSVDLYNPKTIRATQGMIFHINIVARDLKNTIEQLKMQNIPVYGTNVEYGSDVRDLRKNDKKTFALVMGNEGNGVRYEIASLCDKNLYIKTNDDVESLNVAIATSILLYELGEYYE